MGGLRVLMHSSQLAWWLTLVRYLSAYSSVGAPCSRSFGAASRRLRLTWIVPFSPAKVQPPGKSLTYWAHSTVTPSA